MATSSPSAALIRTARNEIGRIQRTAESLERRRASLRAQLEELEAELASCADRVRLLETLLDESAPQPDRSALSWPTTGAIRGRELRRIAGRLLWQLNRDRPMHYRDWFERVTAAGHLIGGKDPIASFLTNVRDSPAVAHGQRPGYYRIDPQSVERVAQGIREVEAERADVERVLSRDRHREPEERLRALQTHRDSLAQTQRRLEGQLDELRHIFEETDGAAEEIKLAAA